MMESFELLRALRTSGYPRYERDPWWWPKSGHFEVIAGVILTQNTNWVNADKALRNIRSQSLDDLDSMADADHSFLAEVIRPSGFFNQKAKRLSNLCRNIREEFGDFETFCASVSREWLLEQKGIGPESVDCILCYACYREEMVVDAYTARMLRAFGFTLEEYDSIKEWLVDGLYAHESELYTLYGDEMRMAQIFARFHGKIVEYCKDHSQSKQVDVVPLQEALDKKTRSQG